MANTVSRVTKGQSQLYLARIQDDGEVPIAVEVPSLFTIANGIEETVNETRSAFGERVRGNIYITAQMPDLTLTVGSGKNNPFWHELLFGYEYEIGNQTVPFTEVIFIPPGTGNYVRPAASSAVYKRHGLEADDEVIAVYLGAPNTGDVPKMSVELEQVNFIPEDPNATPPVAVGGNNPLANNSFMVGDHGLMVFAPNLRGQSVSLTWQEPNIRVIRRSHKPTGFFHIILEVLDDENTIEIFDFQRVRANVNGKTYDPGAETWELGFYVTPFPGQCLPFQHYYTKLKIEC